MIPVHMRKLQRCEQLEAAISRGRKLGLRETKELARLQKWRTEEAKADQQRLMRSLSEADRYQKRTRRLNAGTY